MAARSIDEIYKIRQEQENNNMQTRKIIMKDVLHLDGKISYKELLEMSCIERKILSEAVGEINDENSDTETFRH